MIFKIYLCYFLLRLVIVVRLVGAFNAFFFLSLLGALLANVHLLLKSPYLLQLQMCISLLRTQYVSFFESFQGVNYQMSRYEMSQQSNEMSQQSKRLVTLLKLSPLNPSLLGLLKFLRLIRRSSHLEVIVISSLDPLPESYLLEPTTPLSVRLFFFSGAPSSSYSSKRYS